MTVLSTRVDTRSDGFKRNAESMRGLVDDLRRRRRRGAERRRRQVEPGEAPAHQRPVARTVGPLRKHEGKVQEQRRQHRQQVEAALRRRRRQEQHHAERQRAKVDARRMPRLETGGVRRGPPATWAQQRREREAGASGDVRGPGGIAHPRGDRERGRLDRGGSKLAREFRRSEENECRAAPARKRPEAVEPIGGT